MQISHLAAYAGFLAVMQTAEPRRITGTLDERLVAEGLFAQIELKPSTDQALPGVTTNDRVFRARTPQFRPAGSPAGLAVALLETSDKAFLFIDTNVDGQLSETERLQYTPGSELLFDIRPPGDGPAIPFRCRVMPVPDPAGRGVLSFSAGYRVEGHADIAGRRTLVSLPYNLRRNVIDLRQGKLGLDANGAFPTLILLDRDGIVIETSSRALRGKALMTTLERFLAGQPGKAAVARRFGTVIQLETTSESSANVSMGDLDGDGDLDIVLAKGRHDPLLDRVLLNDGKGAFTASDLGPRADRTYTAALADLDGDGDLDVLTSNDTPDSKMVYLNDGKGRFSVAGTWGVPEWSTRNATVADLNNDGRIDVIAANRPGPSFVCLNEGGAQFASPCIPIPAESATSIVAADFDKDGAIDLAVPSRDGGQSRIYFNDGKAGFARTLPFGPPDAAARVAASADFNRDGVLDLVVGDEKAASVTVYLNDGRGNLTAGFHAADKARTPYAIAAGDLNNDQWPEIVLGYTAGPHSAFFNDGTGRTFSEVKFGDATGAAYGFAIGDIDGDRFNDIALARSGAPNVLYLNGK